MQPGSIQVSEKRFSTLLDTRATSCSSDSCESLGSKPLPTTIFFFDDGGRDAAWPRSSDSQSTPIPDKYSPASPLGGSASPMTSSGASRTPEIELRSAGSKTDESCLEEVLLVPDGTGGTGVLQ
ncbi:hypothetical protein EYF80_019726 [Liparis tanakae]|uniref:Uncharacterized protein n=1 Tax=Liparis tanakae TaxID=230148 RepID=A0A4Z2HWY8_9TELE|nr:hypothetical protein EYF80_019726 [Liparis tanakae]